jgi:hypothetical protein
MLNENFDIVMLIIGDEGTGKSTFSIETALLIDSSFTLDNVYFSTNDLSKFAENLVNTKPGAVHVFDEGLALLYRRNANTRVNKALNTIFRTVRALSQFYIFNVQDMSIDRDFLRRMDIVAAITERGHAALYFSRMSMNMIRKLVRTVDYNVSADTLLTRVGPDLWVRFGPMRCGLWEEYEKKKRQAIVDVINTSIKSSSSTQSPVRDGVSDDVLDVFLNILTHTDDYRKSKS